MKGVMVRMGMERRKGRGNKEVSQTKAPTTQISLQVIKMSGIPKYFQPRIRRGPKERLEVYSNRMKNKKCKN